MQSNLMITINQNSKKNQMKDENSKLEPASLVQENQVKTHLTQQQQILLRNFMSQPFSFIPPPIFHDNNLRGYRESFTQLIVPFTDHYEMFNQKYSLENSKVLKQGQPEQAPSPHKIRNLKQKIFNLKFIGYTILATMIDTLKNIRRQDASNEKLKSCHSLMKKKIEQFYEEANQLKQTFRRLQVIHLLEKESEYLENEAKNIQATVDRIQDYVVQQAKKKQKQKQK